jgi:hypothetical protein
MASVQEQATIRGALEMVGKMLSLMYGVDPETVEVDPRNDEITFMSYREKTQFILWIGEVPSADDQKNGKSKLSPYAQFAKRVDALSGPKPKKKGPPKVKKEKKRREYDPAYDFSDDSQ